MFSEAKRRKRNRKGFSLIELLIVVAIILIIAAIAIPNFLRAKMAANQATAVQNLRTITSAAATYSSTYGTGFPAGLTTLGGAVPATCTGAVLIDEILSTAPFQKSGYQFQYTALGVANPNPPAGCPSGYNQYLLTAVPLSVGQTGQSSYCADDPAAIHVDATGGLAASVAACEALPPLQ